MSHAPTPMFVQASGSLFWYLHSHTFKHSTRTTMAISQVPAITEEQKILVGVEARTEGTTANPDGKPATIDGLFNWEITEGDVTLTEVTNTNGGSSQYINGATPNTTYKVRVWADSDKTPEGVNVIDHEFAGVVTEAGAAELAGVTIGTPEQQ